MPGDVGQGPLCGDPTCESYACTQAALDAWEERQQAEARAIVDWAIWGGPRA